MQEERAWFLSVGWTEKGFSSSLFAKSWPHLLYITTARARTLDQQQMQATTCADRPKQPPKETV